MDDDLIDLSLFPDPQPIYTHPPFFYRVVAACAIAATLRYVFG